MALLPGFCRKGCISGDRFVKLLGHVAKHPVPSNEDAVSLLATDHGSHKDAIVLEFAKQYGIDIMFFVFILHIPQAITAHNLFGTSKNSL